MSSLTAIKADAKMISRDPILMLFMILPIFVSFVFRYLVLIGEPYILQLLDVDLTDYYGYILAMGIIMIPAMLGSSTAFLMIDERDSKINELLNITPIGYNGYLKHRLSLPLILSFLYPFLTYGIMDFYPLSFYQKISIAVLSGFQGVLVALGLYVLAKDKVQALTFSKGLGILNIFALAPLFQTPWFTVLAFFTPFYWTTTLVINGVFSSLLWGGLIHGLYCLLVFKKG